MNEIRCSVVYDLVTEMIHGNNNLDFASSYKNLKNIDREYFHTIILENKIAPIFIKYTNNKDISDFICKAFYEKCKIQLKRYQLQSLQVINEIHEINGLFEKEGLTCIYLKGIAIQKDYEDISLRPMVDIDILFKKEDLLRAYEVLHKNNFLSLNQKKYLDKNNIDDFCRRFYHIHVITKNNISIELHHRVTRPNDFKNCPISKSFFEDFKSIDYFHEKINIPSIKNIIIHSLCHFSINSSFKKLLRTLIDIKRISLNHKICWEEIILKYDNLKIRKSIALSLELIELNKGNIQDLDKLRILFKEYFPRKELVQEAQQNLYDIQSPSSEKIFLNRLKNTKYLTAIAGEMLPSRSTLKFRYKISDIGITTYIKYYYERLLKALSVFLILNKDSGSLNRTNDIESWLNKGK